jgi:hypothetical protein
VRCSTAWSEKEVKAVMDEETFLGLCQGFGLRPLPWHGGYLLASVKPHFAEHFDGCIKRTFQPEQVSNPQRKMVEVHWPGKP